MLAENALKHNSMSSELPLLIRIAMDDGYIVVANNKQKKDTIRNTTQRGLANLSERIKLITGKCLVIEESGDSFVVKVPLIKTVL
jgi:LytS/YehU family sensor histidine kinase